MSERSFDPLRLDMQVFAENAAQLDGRSPITRYQRLVEARHVDAPKAVGEEVAWSAHGELRTLRGANVEIWLHLKAEAQIALECQRCLQPVMTALAVDSRFRFVNGEELAAKLDAEFDDDVLALSRSMNLHDLIEDELLLALPLVPRHATCSLPLPPQTADEAAPDQSPPSPFAALATLKRGGPLN